MDLRSRKLTNNTSENKDVTSSINKTSLHSTKITNKEFDDLRAKKKKERASIVIWRRPITTLIYFIRELLLEIQRLLYGILQHRIKVSLIILLISLMTAAYYIDGSHQQTVANIERQLLWCGYWIGLGILSSVGLGTGLHTFLLYLGPHIASVSMAAWTCNSVEFPEPPYPQDILCPDEESLYPITLWTIMSKVRLEACMWGLGTAIGELPPYFMARAARLSGSEEDDEEYEELEAVLHSQKKDPLTRAKKAVHRLVERVGFFGILLCASIPNPLFDLAGITCGHFLIPFWTFFGATMIGKAIIKMHIQKLFVIIAFSNDHVEWAVNLMGLVPYVGKYLKKPFNDYLAKQKLKLHRKPGSHATQDTSMLQFMFGQLLLAMVAYFIVSIVNSMAQTFAKRKDEEEIHSLLSQSTTR